MRGWSADVYLQSNQFTSAVRFYTQVGFKKMDSNDITELPDPWHSAVNKKEIANFYIKFIDDKTNEAEALRRAKVNKEEVNLLEYLHLYKLTGGIRTIHYPSTLDKKTKELCFTDRSVLHEHLHVPLLPPNSSDVLFPFPYKEVGRRFDIFTSDLLIFGNKKFDFNDNYNFLHLDVHKLRPDSLEGTYCQNVLILRQHYDDLRNNRGKYSEYLATDHLGLCCQWILRNPNSHCSFCFDVI